MAYSNQTTHYGLPLPTGSDKSTWTDTNTAFSAIDQALYEAAQGGSSQAAAIAQLQSQMTTANANISENASDIAEEVATRTAQDAAHTTAIGAINTKLGSNDITGHSDGTVTGILLGLITEANGLVESLTPHTEEATAQTISGTTLNNLSVVGNLLGCSIATRTMLTVTSSTSISTSSSYNYVADMWRLTAAQVSELFPDREIGDSFPIGRYITVNNDNEFTNISALYIYIRSNGTAHIGVRATNGSVTYAAGVKMYGTGALIPYTDAHLPGEE